MGRKSRSKKARSPAAAPAKGSAKGSAKGESPRAPRRTANPEPPPPPRPPPEPVAAYWVLIGSALLCLLPLLEVDGPLRSPRSSALVLGWSAALGSLGLLAFFLRERIGVALGSWTFAAGVLVLAPAFGLCPELFQLPMAGIGERIWGLPIAPALPIAGVALLTGRGSLLAGACCALLIAGLLQPFEIIGDLRPAIAHHSDLATWSLLGLGALGLAAIWVGGSDEESRLPRVTGLLFLLALPSWQLLQLLQASETGHPTTGPIAALLIIAGASAWLYFGVLETLREVPTQSRHALPLFGEALVMLALIGAWLLLKSFTWRYSTTDENIYFYDALLLSKGVLPYREFFFAHPPMHIVLPGLLFAIFGYSLPLAKAIPVLAALGAGLFVWRICREHVNRVAALLALGSYLFAFELLQASTNMNGVNLTSFWLTGGLYFFFRRRPAISGILLGLAVTTGFYAIGAALALLTLGFFRRIQTGLRQLLFFVGVAGGINFLFLIIGGDAYTEAVYKFHLLKEAKPTAHIFIRMLYYQTPLVFGVLLAPVVMAWNQWRGVEPEAAGWFFAPAKLFSERAIGSVKIAWLVCITLLIEFTRFQEVYSFYFTLLFPTAAICTGYTLAGIGAAILHELRSLARGRLKWTALGAVGLAIAWSLWLPTAAECNWVFSAKRGQGVNSEFLQRGTQRHYRWVEPAAWASVSGPVVRALFWRDHRVRGQMTPSYRHFLWQKSLHLSIAQEVGDYVRAHTEEGETIAGGSLVAPAIALTSERGIAAHFVDTNAKRFRAGLTTLPAFFKAICDDKVRFLVSAPNSYLNDNRLGNLPVVRQYFRPVKHFEDPWNKFLRPGRRVWGITLWELREVPTEGPRCAWVNAPPSSRTASSP